MQKISSQPISTRKFERFLAILGTLVCVLVSFRVWQVFSAQQPMWPLPDLYLLEMPAASAFGAWCLWTDDNGTGRSHRRGMLVWVVVGILFAFAIMGAWTVGLLYAPVAGLFALAAIRSDRKRLHELVIHLGIGLAAALTQAGLMLVIIRLL